MFEITESGQIDKVELSPSTGLGSHYLADFYGCRSMPDQADGLEKLLLAAAAKIEATVVTSSFHEFSPHGLSGVVVIAESHLAVHTWPENKVACVDLFTCSSKMDARPGLRLLFETLCADSMKLTTVSRAPLGRTPDNDWKNGVTDG